MNPLEEMENPYYSKLVSIKESTDEFGLSVYTITVIVMMEEHEFKFEQDLTWFEHSKVSNKEIEKYFSDKMLGEEIDLSDMNCYSGSSTCDLDYQMEQAYIHPHC
jgi:hypothetical protein